MQLDALLNSLRPYKDQYTKNQMRDLILSKGYTSEVADAAVRSLYPTAAPTAGGVAAAGEAVVKTQSYKVMAFVIAAIVAVGGGVGFYIYSTAPDSAGETISAQVFGETPPQKELLVPEILPVTVEEEPTATEVPEIEETVPGGQLLMTPPSHFSATYAAVGNKIYSFHEDYIEAYTPSTNTWENKNINGFRSRIGSAAAVVGDKIYLMGGSAEDAVDWVDIYDTRTDSWSQGAPMPDKRARRGANVAIGTKIYFLGGNRLRESRAILEYDTLTDSWESKSDLPFLSRSFSSSSIVFTDGSKIYYVKKEGTLEYDPSADTWTNCGGTPEETKCAPIPIGRDLGSGTAVINGKAYIYGGRLVSPTNDTVTESATEEVVVYDIPANKWFQGKPLTAVRVFYSHYEAVVDGVPYALGGERIITNEYEGPIPAEEETLEQVSTFVGSPIQ